MTLIGHCFKQELLHREQLLKALIAKLQAES